MTLEVHGGVEEFVEEGDRGEIWGGRPGVVFIESKGTALSRAMEKNLHGKREFHECTRWKVESGKRVRLWRDESVKRGEGFYLNNFPTFLLLPGEGGNSSRVLGGVLGV